jgi:hypothetical protein
MKFDLFFKTEALRQRLEPCLSQIPPYFEFTVQTGTPEITIISETDPLWKGFPFPVRRGDVYVFDDQVPAGAVGGAVAGRASVRARDEDGDTILVLRLWHELLHAVNQPADDMIPMAEEWQTPWERLMWWFWERYVGPVDVPFWHRRFYRWLTLRALVEAA